MGSVIFILTVALVSLAFFAQGRQRRIDLLDAPALSHQLRTELNSAMHDSALSLQLSYESGAPDFGKITGSLGDFEVAILGHVPLNTYHLSEQVEFNVWLRPRTDLPIHILAEPLIGGHLQHTPESKLPAKIARALMLRRSLLQVLREGSFFQTPQDESFRIMPRDRMTRQYALPKGWLTAEQSQLLRERVRKLECSHRSVVIRLDLPTKTPQLRQVLPRLLEMALRFGQYHYEHTRKVYAQKLLELTSGDSQAALKPLLLGDGQAALWQLSDKGLPGFAAKDFVDPELVAMGTLALLCHFSDSEGELPDQWAQQLETWRERWRSSWREPWTQLRQSFDGGSGGPALDPSPGQKKRLLAQLFHSFILAHPELFDIEVPPPRIPTGQWIAQAYLELWGSLDEEQAMPLFQRACLRLPFEQLREHVLLCDYPRRQYNTSARRWLWLHLQSQAPPLLRHLQPALGSERVPQLREALSILQERCVLPPPTEFTPWMVSYGAEQNLLLLKEMAQLSLPTTHTEPIALHWLRERGHIPEQQLQYIEWLARHGTIQAVEPLLPYSKSNAVAPIIRESAESAIAQIQSRLGPAKAGQLSVLEQPQAKGALSVDRSQGQLSLHEKNPDEV